MENNARGNLVSLYGWRKLAKQKFQGSATPRQGFGVRLLLLLQSLSYAFAPKLWSPAHQKAKA